MRILLTFTGFHDPYGSSTVEGQRQAGPILTVLANRPLEKVVLFETPNTREQTAGTKAAIEEGFPHLKVEVREVPLKDPTNYVGILKHLRRHISDLLKLHEEGEFFISVSSGTPHMHACWMMLAASGEIPAKLLQAQPPRFVSDPKRRVMEIDFTHPDFPLIRSPVHISREDDETSADLIAVRKQLKIVGDDDAFLSALQRAASLAPYDVHVLLVGETGTGKELFAGLIHALSERPSDRFIAFNCAAYPDTLLDSGLFGHVKGAFTGADRNQQGKFELADGGTLFLDEIGEMPPESQAKLLRALQAGEYEPLGLGRPRKANVRVIAATNRDIATAVRQGKLRPDLFHRFGGVVEIPPLRQRRGDIAKLAQFALDEWNHKHGQDKRLSAEAMSKLRRYSWPGNVRELFKVVEESAMMSSGKTLRGENIVLGGIEVADSFSSLPEPHDGFDISSFCAEVRRRLVERALLIARDNKSAAARLLGVTPQAIHLYLKNQKSDKKPSGM